MNTPEFEDLLDRHGGDLAAWPPELRREASALMVRSGEARAAFRAMADMEAVLRRPLAAPVSAPDAVAAHATSHRQIRQFPLAARRAGWAGAAAAAPVLGLLIGDLGPRHDDNPAAVVAAAFDSSGSSDVE